MNKRYKLKRHTHKLIKNGNGNHNHKALRNGWRKLVLDATYDLSKGVIIFFLAIAVAYDFFWLVG